MELRLLTLCFTYTNHALMAGMTIEVLTQQLVLKDARITMRYYAHFLPMFKLWSIRRCAPSLTLERSYLQQGVAKSQSPAICAFPPWRKTIPF